MYGYELFGTYKGNIPILLQYYNQGCFSSLRAKYGMSQRIANYLNIDRKDVQIKSLHLSHIHSHIDTASRGGRIEEHFGKSLDYIKYLLQKMHGVQMLNHSIESNALSIYQSGVTVRMDTIPHSNMMQTLIAFRHIEEKPQAIDLWYKMVHDYGISKDMAFLFMANLQKDGDKYYIYSGDNHTHINSLRLDEGVVHNWLTSEQAPLGDEKSYASHLNYIVTEYWSKHYMKPNGKQLFTGNMVPINSLEDIKKLEEDILNAESNCKDKRGDSNTGDGKRVIPSTLRSIRKASADRKPAWIATPV